MKSTRSFHRQGRRLPGLFFALALSALPVFAFDDYPRNAALNALHYRLRLTLGENSQEIQATTEIQFEFARDGVREIALDLVGLTVDQVSEENRPAKFIHANGRLTIALGGVYKSATAV